VPAAHAPDAEGEFPFPHVGKVTYELRNGGFPDIFSLRTK
jgi:hypothetical protein